MTASLFVHGAPVVWSGLDLPGAAVASRSEHVHAVARPAIDGLEYSVCGVLVTATAERDWTSDPDAVRCGECTRIAG